MASRFAVNITGTVTWTSSDTSIWSATSGGASGASVPGAADTVTLDANSGSGTIQPNYDFSVVSLTMGAFLGTLDFSAHNNSPTMQTFSVTGTSSRTLNMGTGTFTLTGTGTTLNLTTTTGLTFNAGTSTLMLSNASSSSRSIALPASSPSFYSITVSGGSGNFNFTNTPIILGDLIFTSYSGSWNNGGGGYPQLYGNLELSAAMTFVDGTATFSFLGSGTNTIRTNGAVSKHGFIFNGAGGTWTLLDDVMISGTGTTSVTVTNGSLSLNGFNLTCSSFSSSNTNVRSIGLGSGTVTLTGTGTVWNLATVTNLAFDSGTSTIVMNDSSASSKTFSGGSLSYNAVRISGSGTGAFIMGTNTVTTTIGTWTVDTPPHTVQVFAGKTINVTSLAWSGTAGNLNTFQSTVSGSAWFINSPSGTITEDYLSLQDSYAGGGATFIAGENSISVSNNAGWSFGTGPVIPGTNAKRDQNGKTTIICASQDDGVGIVNIVANPASHGISFEDATTGFDNGNNGGNAMVDENDVPVWTAESSDGSGTIIELYANSNGAILVNSN